jgi:L-threonylcarbamoyladenylate synthase
MKTRLWKLDKKKNSEADFKALKEAAKLICQGELVAFPTETVYGLGANGLSDAAAKKIYAAKGRPSDNPLILHIAKKEDILALTSDLNANAKILMDKFWPGPLTLVLKKSGIIPETVSAGLDTVAVRMPLTKMARTFIEFAKTPIAAPSANKSGRPSPTNAKDVLDDMDGLIAGIIDGGSSNIGVESTIVDTTGTVPMILRPGGITKQMLEEVLGEVKLDPALLLNPQNDENFKPKAPGMKYRHYAPKAKMTLFEGKDALGNLLKNLLKEDFTKQKIGLLISKNEAKTLALKLKEWQEKKEKKEQNENNEQNENSLSEKDLNKLLIYSWDNDKEELAESLYTYLRMFDHEKVEVIFATGVSEEGLGLAIMNRMRKSASYNIVK